MNKQCVRAVLLAGFLLGTFSGAQAAEQSITPKFFTETATSNDPLSLEKATFGLFTIVDGMEKRAGGQGVTFLRNNLKLGDADAVAYLHYIQSSLAASRAAQLQQVRSLCANRVRYETPEALASAFNVLEHDADLLVARLVRDSRNVIGNANKDVADNYVAGSILPGHRTVKPNYAEIMKAGTSPIEILNRLCIGQ